MCEFCTKHGDGKIWYKNASNYSQDLLADLNRRVFIQHFLDTTINEGYRTLGRLETLFRKKGRLPDAVIQKMEERAKKEHFGQVLPMPEISELVLKADTVVRMPCACRWTAGKKEVRCCYAVSYGPEPWYTGIDMSYFGKTGSEGLETVDKSEAVKQMEVLELEGAIHTIWTMMTPFIGAVCNCTALDCIAFRTSSGIHVKTIEKAEHVAVINARLCAGCQVCETKCQFGAIRTVRREGNVSVGIDYRKCYGCGLCVNSCSSGAISLRMK